MKKYLKLFLVLSLVFSMGVVSVNAQQENNTQTLDQSDPATVTENTSDGSSVTPEELREATRARIREMQEVREELQSDTDGVRETTRATIETQREEVKNNVQAIREQATNRIQMLREEIALEKDEVNSKAQEARLQIREQYMNRFNRITQGLETVLNKVTSHTARLKDLGVNVSMAEDYILNATVKLAEAEAKVTEINLLLTESIEGLTDEEKAQIETLKNEIRELLRSAHTDLKEAVKTLKLGIQAKRTNNSADVSQEADSDGQ